MARLAGRGATTTGGRGGVEDLEEAMSNRRSKYSENFEDDVRKRVDNKEFNNEVRSLKMEDEPQPGYCFECDDTSRCASTEICFCSHKDYPKF